MVSTITIILQTAHSYDANFWLKRWGFVRWHSLLRKIEANWKENWLSDGLFHFVGLRCCEPFTLRNRWCQAHYGSSVIPLSCIHVLQSNWLSQWRWRHAMVDLLGCFFICVNNWKLCFFHCWFYPILFLLQAGFFHLALSSQISWSRNCVRRFYQTLCCAILGNIWINWIAKKSTVVWIIC